MPCRKGLAIGRGKGYRNIIGKDPMVHSQSARGMKQPQRMPMFISSGNAKFQKCEMQKPKGEQIYLPVKNQPKMLTKCVSCGTRYAKDRFLFDYCPVCKSKNLKEIKRGGKTQFQKGDAVKSKFTDAKGTILSKDPFAVKYNYKGKTYVRLSNPKYWQKGGKASNVLVSFTKGKEIVYLTLPKHDVGKVSREMGYKAKVIKGGKLPKKVTDCFSKLGGKDMPVSEVQTSTDIDKFAGGDDKPSAIGESIGKAVAWEKKQFPKQIQSIKNIFKQQQKEKIMAESNIELQKAKKLQEQAKKIVKIKPALKPELENLAQQHNRVETLKQQIATQEDKGMDTTNEIEELETEMQQLRQLQEKSTEFKMDNISNAELKKIAINTNDGGGFLSEIFGSTKNKYEEELLRRIKKERIIDKEMKQAKTEPLEDEGLF